MGDPKVLHEHAESFRYPRSVEVAKMGDRFDAGRYGIQPLRNVEMH
jgi:L-ascorbate 6-phosphate lactonase